MQFPSTQYLLLSVPEPHVLLITINRPKQLNALNPEANFEMSRVLDWAEDNDDIWCIIVSLFFLYLCGLEPHSGGHSCRLPVKVTRHSVQAWTLSIGTRPRTRKKNPRCQKLALVVSVTGPLRVNPSLQPSMVMLSVFYNESSAFFSRARVKCAYIIPGGGTEMVLACNIVVATKRSKFGLPEGNSWGP